MKALVTGGAGFIGSNLVDALIERGDKVWVIDDLTTGRAENVNPKAHFMLGSIANFDVLDAVVKKSKPDAIFHLAAWARVPRSIEDPIGTHNVNVNGTLNILQSARLNKVKRVVYSSSSSVYGDQDTPIMKEDLIPNPKSPYALHKLMGEQYANIFSKIYKLPIISLRYFNVYGPRQAMEGAYSLVIGKFLQLKKEGKPMTIYGDGSQTRAYTHVSDIIGANLRAVEVKMKDNDHFIFNIGSRIETSVKGIANMICGDREYIYPNPRGEFEEKRKCADYSKAKEILGWEPKIGLKEGIKRLKDAQD